MGCAPAVETRSHVRKYKQRGMWLCRAVVDLVRIISGKRLGRAPGRAPQPAPDAPSRTYQLKPSLGRVLLRKQPACFGP